MRSGVMIWAAYHGLKQALVAEAWSSFSDGFRKKKNDEIQDLIQHSSRDVIAFYKSKLRPASRDRVGLAIGKWRALERPTSFQKSFSNPSIF
jgi:hypothetical protein